MQIYTILSGLLHYPTKEMQADGAEALAMIEADKLLKKSTRKEVLFLINYLTKTDLLALQMKYVELFDRTPSISLHLFEHVHGDDSARGQALADLKGVYLTAGLDMLSGEFPDYLPLFLEYLAAVPVEISQESLKELTDLLEILRNRLSNRKSPYAAVLSALVELSKFKPDHKKVQDALKLADGSLPNLEEIDKEWEEEPAFNGAQPTSCPHASTCQKGDSL